MAREGVESLRSRRPEGGGGGGGEEPKGDSLRQFGGRSHGRGDGELKYMSTARKDDVWIADSRVLEGEVASSSCL